MRRGPRREGVGRTGFSVCGASSMLVAALSLVVMATLLAGCSSLLGNRSARSGLPSHHHASRSTRHGGHGVAKGSVRPHPTTTTSTTAPPPSTLPPPGPGFVAGRVTAVGDSVMIDYETPLEQDVPGIQVYAAVSRQWSAGEAILAQLKAEDQLGAIVVVGLGTNGPITTADFNTMMSILSGASRVVFVTVHVGQPWQNEVNGVIESNVGRFPNAVIADWASLADANPGWLYSDGTHLPIDGPGAQALAALVASKVNAPLG